MPATISIEGRVKHVQFRCVCGYSLTAWVLASGPIFYRRPGPPREPVRLGQCPNCRLAWPKMSGEEFLEAIAG